MKLTQQSLWPILLGTVPDLGLEKANFGLSFNETIVVMSVPSKNIGFGSEQLIYGG